MKIGCLFRSQSPSTDYHRLDSPTVAPEKSACSLFSWTQRLKTKAKAICSFGRSRSSGRPQVAAGGEVADEKFAAPVPKGHLAVYVGQKDGDFRRVLVPVMYFNHPLFGELLREAENEFGFSHPGGITIPIRISDFERVRTRIKQGRGARKTAITGE